MASDAYQKQLAGLNSFSSTPPQGAPLPAFNHLMNMSPGGAGLLQPSPAASPMTNVISPAMMTQAFQIVMAGMGGLAGMGQQGPKPPQ